MFLNMSAIEVEYTPRVNAPAFAPPPSTNNRRSDRAVANLKTIVQVREDAENGWKEVTKVTTVARNGVGFTLKRPCTVGKLVNLILPMPPEYRVYDEDRDLYQIAGIVQHCNAATVGGERVFHIGIGLVGKEFPPSFEQNPAQNFRIVGTQENGLWAIAEAASQFKNRKHPRYWVTLPATVALIHREDEIIRKEDTFTKNVSTGGVSVRTALNARIGDKVRIACPPLDFHAIAIVRNIKKEDDRTATLHLEFDGQTFPVDRVMPARGSGEL
jgi:hypothetical protein